ncbi:Zinc/iron permease like protein [Aduncisulcus paluster]|uniref:Zinc/iron permease like protein n=1 Tax=Aduncisulcus paluster TaxID=2918883 RepID=A0ABQ5KRI6_9EUKA|nr:Zinc/iron permease like protein [Aduncisulcus paluster]
MLRKCDNADRAISLANAFAGGVFITAGFMHMLAEANENWEDLLPDVDFPICNLIVVLTFFLILAIEHVFVPQEKLEQCHVHSIESAALLGDKEEGEDHDHHHGGHEHHHEHHHSHGEPENTFITVLVTLIALSVHAFLTGISLGLQSDMSDAAFMLIAIVAHKWCEVMGMAIVIMRTPGIKRWQTIGALSLIILITPLGQAIGVIMLHYSSDTVAAWMTAIGDAMAGGTFTYVSIVEMIVPEFSNRSTSSVQVWKLLLALLGVAIMSLVALVM